MASQYFATVDSEKIAFELSARVQKFNDYLNATGLRDKWTRQYQLYFGKHLGENGVRSTSVQFVGDDGELTAFGVNYYRNLIKHSLSLTTGAKPSYDVRSKNTDLKSLQQTKIGANLIEGYMGERRMGRDMKQAAEIALAMDKGFIYLPWNKNLGDRYAPQIDPETGMPNGKFVYEGDPDPQAKLPFDVIYDPSLKDWKRRQWVIVRCFENKWDLASQNPEMSDQIIKCGARDDNDPFTLQRLHASNSGYSSDDLIPVYHFYHEKSDAVINGRYVKFLNKDITLYDGPMPYKRLPIHRITPGDQFDTAEGYSESSDLMVLQEVMNVLSSIPFSNQQAFSNQIIWLPEGCNISPTPLGKGPVFLKGGLPGAEPKAINLMSTPAEVFKNLEFIKGAQTELMGLNSAVTSDPASNLKSGAAIGRVQAMAIQFASNFQQSWAELQEDCGTAVIHHFQSFANTKRVAANAGIRGASALESFTKEDIQDLDRVVVDIGNPLSQTAAGRIELADMLLEKNMVANAKEYITVLKTGNVDTMTEDIEDENELIRKENEGLLKGIPARALVGDSHIYHSKKHRAVLNDPTIRSLADQGDETALKVVELTLSHIQEHDQLAQTESPFYKMLSGEPPVPMPPPPMPPPPPQGGPMDMGAPPPPQDMQGPPPGPDAGLPPPPPMPPMVA
jgi:hypothetical protein